MAPVDLNSAPTFRCNFQVSGVDTDPTTVSLYVRMPDGTTATYTYAGGTLTKDSVGDYSKQITLNQRGIWYYAWTGTGACQASDSGTVTVIA